MVRHVGCWVNDIDKYIYIFLELKFRYEIKIGDMLGHKIFIVKFYKDDCPYIIELISQTNKKREIEKNSFHISLNTTIKKIESMKKNKLGDFIQHEKIDNKIIEFMFMGDALYFEFMYEARNGL